MVNSNYFCFFVVVEVIKACFCWWITQADVTFSGKCLGLGIALWKLALLLATSISKNAPMAHLLIANIFSWHIYTLFCGFFGGTGEVDGRPTVLGTLPCKHRFSHFSSKIRKLYFFFLWVNIIKNIGINHGHIKVVEDLVGPFLSLHLDMIASNQWWLYSLMILGQLIS